MIVNPVDRKELTATITQLPAPQLDLDLEAGPKDISVSTTECRAESCPEPEGRPSAGLPPGSIPAPQPDLDLEAADRGNPRQIRQWKSPILMLIFYIIGLAMSIGHCIFYPLLDGVIVGDSSDQERNIRFGTAFAFLTQIAFTASVWLCYTQWLWKSVKNMSAKGLNAVFSADTSPFSLLNMEMLKKFKMGSAMALFAWCLALPPFFTPATLFVTRSTNVVEVEQSVPTLTIANASTFSEFAFSIPTSRTRLSDDNSKVFAGPRTILSLLSTATASLGRILPIKPPYNHSSYSVQFDGPIVQCDQANSSAATAIDSLLRDKMAISDGVANETENVYYAFVPAFDAAGRLMALSKPRLQYPSNATNQLWMTYLRYAIDLNGNHIRERDYQVCQLYNATYDLTLEWDGGIQHVSPSYKVHEAVHFPNKQPDPVSGMSRHAYSALFWALTNQVVGSFGWFEEVDRSDGIAAAQFGVIDTPISRTSLLGSSDLDLFFDLDNQKGWSERTNTTELSDQRLQDKALARNRTLAVLIEELSFNTTVSLLNNELLTANTSTATQVRRHEPVNRYRYNRRDLFLPYAVANLFSLVIVLLGLGSYSRHGVFPDRKFQDIIEAVGEPHVIRGVLNRTVSFTAEKSGERLVLRPGMVRVVGGEARGRGRGRG